MYLFFSICSILSYSLVRPIYNQNIRSTSLENEFLHAEHFSCTCSNFDNRVVRKLVINLESNDTETIVKDFMLNSINWYRTTLSPIMPPNCRFLPTCSNYGIDAIRKYGPWKGGILTAWRIFRCNPIGGSGYDPPQWPPPGFFAGSNSRFK